MKTIWENRAIIIIVLCGLIIATIVATVLFRANQTIMVWVPNRTLVSGDVVRSQDLQQIEIHAHLPGNFIRDNRAIIGQRLRHTVEAFQLLYPVDFLGAWESFTDGDIPIDFTVTNITVPDDRAVAGTVIPGDYIDVWGTSRHLPIGFTEVLGGRMGINAYVVPILSNVRVISTNSPMAQAQAIDLGFAQRGVTNYIVALSYENFKKIRQAEMLFDIWIAISPAQNADNPPLLEQMIGQSWSILHNAALQVANPDGTPISPYLVQR